ncbi:hypothetical protein Hanom_Chr06g00509021 [Helianthus anomalus]
MSGCLGTSSQVLFLIKALNSVCMALYHSGLDKAALGLVGMGTMEVVERLKMCLGFEIPDIARVCIVRDGGIGGGFGIGLVSGMSGERDMGIELGGLLMVSGGMVWAEERCGVAGPVWAEDRGWVTGL